MDSYYVEIKGNLIENEIVKIDMDDIYSLALIAAKLEPCLPAITEINGHIEALSQYFVENPEHRLKKVYELIINDYLSGIRIITSSTALALYEKEFRDNGIIDPEKIEKYNGWAKEHRKTLEVNKFLFEEKYNNKNSKTI